MVKTFGSLDDTFANHAVPNVKTRHRLSHFYDFSAPFMARGDRIGDRDDVSASEKLIIRVTDPHSAGANQDFRVLDLRHGQVFDDGLAGGFEYKSLHLSLQSYF